MVLFIVCGIIVGCLCCYILIELCQCTKIDDMPEVDNAETDYVPTKTDIEKHNAQVEQQWIIKQKKAQRHISGILNKAFNDYVNNKIKENSHIDNVFIICEGEYGITYSEILAINRPFTYNMYTVECPYSDTFYKYYIKVTVND